MYNDKKCSEMNFDGRGEKTTELRAGKNGMRALIKKKCWT